MAHPTVTALEIIGDSELLINAFTGKTKLPASNLVPSMVQYW